MKENCPADCSSCPTFPAPFRRIGDSTYCRFAEVKYRSGEGVCFPGDRMVRIVFVLSGALMIDHAKDTPRMVTSMQCVCLARGERYEATAHDETHVVVLSLIHRIEFCEQDIFGDTMPPDTERFTEAVPVLPIHQNLQRLLSDLFAIRELNNCIRYHRMKAAEMFMMIRVLYSTTEQARFSGQSFTQTTIFGSLSAITTNGLGA